MLKSVPMACKAPTVSSSSTQSPITNAIPATPTALRGKNSQDKDESQVWDSMVGTLIKRNTIHPLLRESEVGIVNL